MADTDTANTAPKASDASVPESSASMSSGSSAPTAADSAGLDRLTSSRAAAQMNGLTTSDLTQQSAAAVQTEKDQTTRAVVSWVKYYVLVTAGLDLNQLNPVMGLTQTNEYGDVPEFDGFQLVEVTQDNADPNAWAAYTNNGVSVPLAISSGHLELGTPVIIAPPPADVVADRMSAIMRAVQTNGWGMFVPMPDDVKAYGQQLSALVGKADLKASDIPAIPASIAQYFK